MAEKKSWFTRCREAFHLAHDVHWLWTLFPASWKAFVMAGIVGIISFLLARIQHANLAKIWLYTVSAVAIYGIGWACVQIAPRITEGRHRGRIAFTAYELHRTREAGELTSIFLRVKMELSGLGQASGAKYRMELSCNGVLNEPEFRDDAARFEITDWSHSPIPHDELRPLPKDLKEHTPVEGWVHFVTTWNDNQLHRSYVRLFADTANASGSLEIRPGRENWNPVTDRMIVSKDLGSITPERLS